MNHDEDELIERARAGDRAALVTLLEKHTPRVRARIAARIPPRWRSLVSVDDVMQQTYTDALLDVERFDPRQETTFSAWLLMLAKCNLLDVLRAFRAERRGGGRGRVEPRSLEDSFTALYERLGGVTQSTPSRGVARREACEAMRRAIALLPESYRRVVEMYDLEGRTGEEVAAVMGRSRAAVYMMRARAHRLLAEHLGSASRFLSTG